MVDVTECFSTFCIQTVYRESATIHKGRLFCNDSCQQQHDADTFNCTTCNTLITSNEVYSQQTGRTFCSRKCEDAGKCGQCHNSLVGARIILGTAAGDVPFCSGSCKDKYLAVDTAIAAARNEQRTDMIEPDYYHTTSVYEPFKIIRYYGLNFFEGNVLKYLLRAGKKASATRLEDLQKAATYLASEIEETKKEN